MSPLLLRFQRSFYLRHAFVGGLFAFFSIALALLLKQLGPLRFLAPVLFFAPWLFFFLREYRLSAKQLDEQGVTRRDGKRFLWSDLHHLQEACMHLTPGRPGPLNNVDLIFPAGRVRILHLVLENGWEAITFAKQKAAQRLTELRRRIHTLITRETQRRRDAGPPPAWPASHQESRPTDPEWPGRTEG